MQKLELGVLYILCLHFVANLLFVLCVSSTTIKSFYLYKIALEQSRAEQNVDTLERHVVFWDVQVLLKWCVKEASHVDISVQCKGLLLG